MDETVFGQMLSFSLIGEFQTIEIGLFKHFSQLKDIIFFVPFFRKLCHQGIDWMFDLNFGVQVNLSNTSWIGRKNFKFVTIYLQNKLLKKDNISAKNRYKWQCLRYLAMRIFVYIGGFNLIN